MLKRQGQSLPFTAFFVASKTGKTGLTVTVDVYRDGASVVTNGSATALGGGLYGYTLSGASTGTAGFYVCIFKTTDTTVSQQHIPSGFLVGDTLDSNLTQVNGLPTNDYQATLKLKMLDIQNSDGTAFLAKGSLYGAHFWSTSGSGLYCIGDLEGATLVGSDTGLAAYGITGAGAYFTCESGLGLELVGQSPLFVVDNSLSQAQAISLIELQANAAAAASNPGLSSQGVRDAMKLAPTAGAAAAGSVDAKLDAIPTAGTGARTITVTVEDDGDPVPGASVRLNGGPTTTAAVLTDADGEASFAVDDGTYAVAITKSGYVGSSSSLTVDGNESVTVTLTPVTTPTAPSGSITAHFYTVDDGGNVQANATAKWRLLVPASGGAGKVFEYGDPNTVTSDANGLASISVIPGSVIEVWRKLDRRKRQTIPADAVNGHQIEDV